MYQFKVKDSEIKRYLLQLDSIPKDLQLIYEETELKGVAKRFSLDCNAIDT